MKRSYFWLQIQFSISDLGNYVAAKNCGIFPPYYLTLRDIPQSCSPRGFQACIKLQVKKFDLSIQEKHLLNDLSAAVGSSLL